MKILLVTLLQISALGFAQEYVVPASAHLGVDMEDSKNLTRASVSVTLKGEPVKNLTKDDFVILEDSVPQKIVKFSTTPPATNTAIILDCSGSMQGHEDSVKRAVQQFVNTDKRPQDRFAIICAANGDQQFLLNSLTSDRQKISKGIDQYLVWGGTYLAQAIERSILYLNFAAPAEFNQIVIISDGHDVKSQSEIKKTFSLAGKQQTPINVIAINSNETTEKDAAFLKALASQTGGIYVSTSQPSGLSEAFRKMTVGVDDRYTLWYRSDTDTRSVGVVVQVVNQPDLELSYHRRVYSGAMTPEQALKITASTKASPIPFLPPPRNQAIIDSPPGQYSVCHERAVMWELGINTWVKYKGPVLRLSGDNSSYNTLPTQASSYVEISDPKAIVGTCYIENHNSESVVLRPGMTGLTIRGPSQAYSDKKAYEVSVIAFDSTHYDSGLRGISLRCQLSLRHHSGDNESLRLEELKPLFDKFFQFDFRNSELGEECHGGDNGGAGGHS